MVVIITSIHYIFRSLITISVLTSDRVDDRNMELGTVILWDMCINLLRREAICKEVLEIELCCIYNSSDQSGTKFLTLVY